MNPDHYFNDLISLIKPNADTLIGLEGLKIAISKVSSNNGKVIAIGNGGSASIANHFTVDLSKNAGKRAVNFNEANLITCLSNDAGLEYWMKEALNIYADRRDLVILISSSGESANVVNAAKYCLDSEIELVTFTGMSQKNTLKSLNSNGLNFWVNSMAYNHIENVHQCWLLFIVDACIGQSVYEARIHQKI